MIGLSDRKLNGFFFILLFVMIFGTIGYAQIVNDNNQKTQLARAIGYYNSPEFKSSRGFGQKPASWFDAKYPNSVSNQNLPPAPSALSGPASSRTDDAGEFFLQKLAKQYLNRGEKSFNPTALTATGRSTFCINYRNFDGYTFGRFPCPLPTSTGMNPLNQFCCGPTNYQYCCSAQESAQYQTNLNFYNGKSRSFRRLYYPPQTTRVLAIVLPLVIISVIALAIGILFLYYKKVQQHPNKPSYKAIPQIPTNSNA